MTNQLPGGEHADAAANGDYAALQDIFNPTRKPFGDNHPQED